MFPYPTCQPMTAVKQDSEAIASGKIGQLHCSNRKYLRPLYPLLDTFLNNELPLPAIFYYLDVAKY